MRRSHWGFLKNTWFIVVVTTIAIICVVVWMRTGTKPPLFDSVEVSVGDVKEVVSVTGTISPVDKADLAFEKSGVIKMVSVKVGDSVKKGQVIALLDDSIDKAALTSAQATLDDASRSLTPQELSVQETALVNAQNAAVNAAQDAFVKAQSAIFNYADGFFNNPQSVNPTITIRVGSATIEYQVNNTRVIVTETLNSWAKELTTLASDPAALIAKSNQNLLVIKGFMKTLSDSVNDLSPGNSGLSQTTITSYITTMNTGLTVINSAIDGVATARSTLTAAQSSYDLKLSGNSSQSIAALAAKVAQARALLEQDTLISPIDGVVTRADPRVGEFASVGKTGFSIQNNDFKVEAYVPESDIAKISIGNSASSTLDAYGSYVDFPAEVILIDPAETILEGVPTYKVTLHFTQPDERIRSGMTANLDISTRSRLGVVRIPYRALVTTATSTTVRLVTLSGKSFVAVPVVAGLKGSDGTVEITSGISPGQKVVTYVK